MASIKPLVGGGGLLVPALAGFSFVNGLEGRTVADIAKLIIVLLVLWSVSYFLVNKLTRNSSNSD